MAHVAIRSVRRIFGLTDSFQEVFTLKKYMKDLLFENITGVEAQTNSSFIPFF